MHIVLAILGSIVTILILLNRLKGLGIDFGWLNPFTWHRRRQWKLKVNKNPIYTMDTPMEAVAGLLYTAAKCSGDITQEHKKIILKIFTEEFEMKESDATELLSSTSFLVKDEDDIINNLKSFLALSIEKFSAEQRKKTLTYVETVMKVDEKLSSKQQKFLEKLNGFMTSDTKQGDW